MARLWRTISRINLH